MSLLRRKKGEDEEIESADDMLDDSEVGSMFISAEGAPAAAVPEREGSAAGGDEPDPAAAEAVDGLESDGEQPEDEPGAEGEAEAEDKKDYEVQTVSASEDDALALFGDVAGQSGLGDLTDDLEEMSIEELVAELREIRGMLPAVAGDADDPTEG